MSRDLTPKELDIITKNNTMPNLVDTLTIKIGETNMPAYSEEQKELAHTYPKLGRFGFDMLNSCRLNGVYSNEDGKKLLQKLEDYFNNIDINDRELSEAAQAWYEGVYCPGYYMNDNDSEFAAYLKSRISMKVFGD
ncbi:MAG: hypothetical protein IJZ79_01380 [Bacilli bacterium]|nr:hypothetical protein [Bacilli bacterium]